MDKPFEKSAAYYDLLYQDKDYEAETAYITEVLARFDNRLENVLELGCGTGRHASHLVQSGINVTGIDRSETMLLAAKQRVAESSRSLRQHETTSTKQSTGLFRTALGDARDFRDDKSYDAVLALFHVASYHTTNEAVADLFQTASANLKKNGLFLFDIWYGPAVLSIKPTVRVKRIENDEIRLLRVAEPTLRERDNCVNVHYTIFKTNRDETRAHEFCETHVMRYFFEPELKIFAEKNDLEIIHCEEWMTGRSPSNSTWGVNFVARKK